MLNLGLPSVASPPHHRPAASAFSDGIQGRASHIHWDGTQMVEGVNPLANHMHYKDGLRRKGTYKEHRAGWRHSNQRRNLPDSTLYRDLEERFDESGMNMDDANLDFRRSLRGISESAIKPSSQRSTGFRGELGTSKSSSMYKDGRLTLEKRISFNFPAVIANPAAARAHLRHLLLVKFKSILGAWRVLDPHGNGRFSFFDFCRAMKQVGAQQDVRALWEGLDGNEDGFVTLEDLDPDLATLLLDFYIVVMDCCGSAKQAWREFFCNSGMGRCSRNAFLKLAHEMGFDGDSQAVFTALSPDKAPGGILYKDFALLDKWFKLSIGSDSGSFAYSGLRPTSSSPDILLH